jgi:hypothetical protein
MSDFKEEYGRHLLADLQKAKEQYDVSLEAFKEAERKIIGAQYSYQVFLDYDKQA